MKVEKRRPEKRRFIPAIREILAPVFVAFVISLIIIFFFRFVLVRGQSMEPSLYDGQKLLMNVRAYAFSAPERGDIIVVHYEEADRELIKRVIGLPGETVEVRDNVIYIDGEALEEPYLKEPMVTGDIPASLLAQGEYFICGDNRNHSMDSRSPMVGNITKDEIFGKIIFNFTTMKAASK